MSNCKCGSEPLEHGGAEYTERFPQLDAVNKPGHPGSPGREGALREERRVVGEQDIMKVK